MNYWIQRQIETQNKLTDKSIKQTETQLKKYYRTSMKKVIEDFESTLNTVLLNATAGSEITPADLYKLDKYWQMQRTLKDEMQKLGDKQIGLMSAQFENQYIRIYETFKLTSQAEFATISTQAAQSAINTIWCADGKHFSQRIWDNQTKLIKTLNDELVNCVVSGKRTSDLKKQLINRFNVSYNQADMLVRTEMAHIQTQASADRYRKDGIQKYEFIADTDKCTCGNCASLDGKIFKMDEMEIGVNCPPLHPNDRCCIAPYIEKI